MRRKGSGECFAWFRDSTASRARCRAGLPETSVTPALSIATSVPLPIAMPVCPLWKETATLLDQLLTERSVAGPTDRPVFTGTTEAAITRFGIYKIIRGYTSQVVKKGSGGRSRAVSPHGWRHSTAVHLLEAGVEVNVIRAWLGHTSLETTNRYAEITPRTKQAALEKCVIPAAPEERIPKKPVWQTDAALLTWLQSL